MPLLAYARVAVITTVVLALATPVVALATDGSDGSEPGHKTVSSSNAAPESAAPDVLQGPALFLRASEQGASRGTRSDRQFFEISRTGSNDVPTTALTAYRRAAATMAAEQPGCGIDWSLLAAIGRVESNHGRFGGAQLGSDGLSRPAIRGPRLDGGAFAAIPDTDHGVLDGDTVWDRAVGPMQFLPSTWRSAGRDGDDDGRKNPDDINDAALAAAGYLCGAGGSLSDEAGAARAVFRYNHSDYYVQLVLSFARGYESGVFAEPPPPPQSNGTDALPRIPRKKGGSAPASAASSHAATSTASHTASSTPTQPSTPPPTSAPTPTPTPTPAPSPTAYDETGSLVSGGADRYVLQTSDGQVELDVAPVLDQGARADFDGDGVVETNRDELDGLITLGRPVHVEGTVLNGEVSVQQIGDQDF